MKKLKFKIFLIIGIYTVINIFVLSNPISDNTKKFERFNVVLIKKKYDNNYNKGVIIKVVDVNNFILKNKKSYLININTNEYKITKIGKLSVIGKLSYYTGIQIDIASLVIFLLILFIYAMVIFDG